MSSFICSAVLLSLAANICVQAANIPRTTEDHLSRDARTLHKFALTVTYDTNNITGTWDGTNVCSFGGVVCGKIEKRTFVSGIDINKANIGNSLVLKGLLDKLTDLDFFHANTNGFVGGIPSLKDLSNLKELDLSNNLLDGPFPLSVLDPPIKYLDLRFNSFTGELPSKLFTSTKAETLYLNNNLFTGQLPEFSNIPTKLLVLANNGFTGPIPVSMAKAKHLQQVLLLGNQFTGTIPEEICALDLQVLDVSNNKLNLTLGPNCKKMKAKGVLVV